MENNGAVDVTTDPDAVFESNPIIELFGNSMNLRILITLIDAAGSPMPASEIADQSNISTQSFYENRHLLLEYGLIEEADMIGNATRYRVDMESEPIQAVSDFYDAMIDIQSMSEDGQ